MVHHTLMEMNNRGKDQEANGLDKEWNCALAKLDLNKWIHNTNCRAFLLSSHPIYLYLFLESRTYRLHCPGTQMACLSKQWGRRSIIHQHAESLLRSVLHKIRHDNPRASWKGDSTTEEEVVHMLPSCQCCSTHCYILPKVSFAELVC